MPPGKHEHGNNYLQRGRAPRTALRKGPVGGSDERPMELGLDGEPVGTTEDRYHNLKDRMPVHPVTIWPLPMDRWQRDLRKLVGDEGQLRADSFMGGSFLPSENGARANAASIFNPMLAGALVQAYSNPGDLIIDPFAGGGTRGIIAGAMDRRYVGCDIRVDEVERVNARMFELGLDEVGVITADAASCPWQDRISNLSSGTRRKADMLLTCPPYWNLEVYSDDPNDLSTTATYEEFLDGIEKVIVNSLHAVKNGAPIVWVVGEFRDPETSELLDFPGDIVRIHQRHGSWLYDRFIYTHANPQAFWRMGVFDKTRKLIRVHEHVIVMRYGQPVKPKRKAVAKARAGGGDYWS